MNATRSGRNWCSSIGRPSTSLSTALLVRPIPEPHTALFATGAAAGAASGAASNRAMSRSIRSPGSSAVESSRTASAYWYIRRACRSEKLASASSSAAVGLRPARCAISARIAMRMAATVDSGRPRLLKYVMSSPAAKPYASGTSSQLCTISFSALYVSSHAARSSSRHVIFRCWRPAGTSISICSFSSMGANEMSCVARWLTAFGRMRSVSSMRRTSARRLRLTAFTNVENQMLKGMFLPILKLLRRATCNPVEAAKLCWIISALLSFSSLNATKYGRSLRLARPGPPRRISSPGSMTDLARNTRSFCCRASRSWPVSSIVSFEDNDSFQDTRSWI
mmetsp:Transcript_4373/g.12628  ORF Transcript_4373/g.12628 Transcript_4373/m.12628 type:complete len:337 (-) Transcript_4373:701-1711(-)